MESGSLNHELLKFLSMIPQFLRTLLFINNVPNFPFLHSVTFSKEFNLKFPLEKFRGKYYLIACDGSEFNIARNPDDPDTFHEVLMANLYPVLIWFIPSLYMSYVLSGILI